MSRVRLGDVVQRIKDPVDKDNTDLIYYVGGEHFTNRAFKVTNKGLIKGSTIGPAFNTRFKSGDVLLMSRNPHLRKAGMVEFDGICSDVSYVIRTKDEKVLMQRFIPLLFQTDMFWEFAEKNKKGSTNFFLNWKDFEQFEFELPEMEKQIKLVEMLWSMVNTMDSYEEMLIKQDELIKSQFIEMFGSSDKSVFPIKPLSSISEYWNGLTYSPKDVTTEEGTLVLRSSNIQDGTLYLEDNVYVSCSIKEKQFVKKDDILMCSRNGSAKLVGKVALIPELDKPTTFGAFMMIIRSKYSRYLKTFFELDDFRKQINTGTATINQITGGMMDKVMLPVPPVESVDEFYRVSEQIDKSKFEIEKSLTELKMLFQKIVKEQLEN